MSDDLVKRLRDCPDMDAVDEAADALEDQAARIAELEAALRNIEADCCSDCPPSHGAIKYACRDALEGGKKDE